MTIKKIKKEIINKILNDDIVSNIYFESSNKTALRGIVYDYLTLPYGDDFISLDISEKESGIAINKGDKTFTVLINLGFHDIHKNDENKLDLLSECIENIINDLYPGMKRYQNIPIQNKDGDGIFVYTNTIRQITFELD